MNMQVTIGFNPEALSAISELTAAIRGLSGGVSTAPAAAAGKTEKAITKPADDKSGEDNAEAVVIWWGNNTAGTFGTVDSEDAFKALKKKDAKVVKLTEAQFTKKTAEAAAAAKVAASKPAATDAELPSEDDLIEAFSTYLPAEGLDEATKKERRAFVKAVAARFGVAKASLIGEDDRALAINLVLRKNAGQDIDPEDAEFEEFDADEDDGI